ncbi:serine/arginine-rich splicing factor 7-like isoform X2 [Dermacentor albipictus]|uniref:serine/arginine-rich splicing factor 7-like isoform X2 n=1 Tax=Dermacentor albipictus TaxID=60249 RepID=UPI0031FBD33B
MEEDFIEATEADPVQDRDYKQRLKTAEELRGRPTQKGQRRSRSRSRSRARRPRWFGEEDSDQGQGGGGSGHKSRSRSRNRSRSQSRDSIRAESYPPLAKQTSGPGQWQGQQQQLQQKSSGVKNRHLTGHLHLKTMLVHCKWYF